VSDERDDAKFLFHFQRVPSTFMLNGCSIYVNNPNGAYLYASKWLKVFGCKIINKFNRDGYPNSIISTMADNNYIVGNIFDTSEANATYNDTSIVHVNRGGLFFANNVGVMTKKYGFNLASSWGGSSGTTWTFMNNVFPKYPNKGATADGVTYVDVGNIYSGTT
jgi:hypothetical protein